MRRPGFRDFCTHIVECIKKESIFKKIQILITNKQCRVYHKMLNHLNQNNVRNIRSAQRKCETFRYVEYNGLNINGMILHMLIFNLSKTYLIQILSRVICTIYAAIERVGE